MHEEEREGLTRITHLAFHRKFAKYATDGFEVLYPRPPVIYVSAAAKHNLGQHLCHQLGLPLSAVCTVPCEAGRMDISALQKLIEDDISSGKTPTLVVSFAGTPLL
jgi:glutamate/tyrosine decarboxylase-like PLP-dependent enzyme